MQRTNTSIDYDLGGVTYDIVAHFERYYKTKHCKEPYDFEWAITELEIFNEFEPVPQEAFANIGVLRAGKFLPVLDDIREKLIESL